MLNPSYHLAVSAGAGTGKTYSLVENYVQALLGLDQSGIKKRPEQILALTFTQKAAQEMRVRIAKRLNGLLKENLEHDDPLLLLTKNAEPFAREEIKLLLRALPNAVIATFHGFSADILRKEAKALGLSESFTLLLPEEEKKLAQNILRPLLLERLKEPNSVLRSLVARFRLGSHPASLGLIDALLQYYASLFEQGLMQSAFIKSAQHASFDLSGHIAAIQKAALEFRSPNALVQKRLDEVLALCQELKCSTEADFIADFLRIKQAIKGNFGDMSSRRALVFAVKELGAHAVDHFVQADEEGLLALMASFHAEFCKAKDAMQKLSYSDLLSKMGEALAGNAELRSRLKKRFLHVLIDEYQDTSPLQETIIAYLCENKTESQMLPAGKRALTELDLGQGASLFVVGDKKQSIYGFRGADITLFDSMLQKMALTHKHDDAFTRRLLTINRRSAATLIKVVNLVSRHALKTQGYEPNEDLEVFDDQKGIAELWVSADDKELSNTDANLWCSAHGVAQCLSRDETLKANDIVILVRRMRSATKLSAMLAELGIAARVVGGEGFFQEQEVVDVLSALKLIIDPDHALASAIVFRSPILLFSDQDLLMVHAATAEGGLSLTKATLAQKKSLLSEKSNERLSTLVELLSVLKRDCASEGLAWAVDRLLATFDLPLWYGLLDDGEQAMANVQKLRTLLMAERQNPFVTIEACFEAIFQNQREAQAVCTKDADFVTIMTIHQSKGLEFKAVVLADGESALPTAGADMLPDPEGGLALRPKGRAIKQAVPESDDIKTRYQGLAQVIRDKEQAEVARLLYVALTRAKTELYIACSQSSFRKKTSARSIIDLFLGAYREYSEEFSALCPLREIGPVPKRTPQAQSSRKETPLLYVKKSSVARAFSSSLEAPPSWSFMPFIKQDLKKVYSDIDGSLAHRILALAGTALAGFAKADRALVDHVIDAVFRTTPFYADQAKAQRTKEACGNTLLSLHSAIHAAEGVRFETPIACWPDETLFIEGIADLVLDFSDHIAVIEFKSSFRLATHANTYMQIFAYAQGLKAHSQKPIKFASVLVGSDSEIVWSLYDERCEGAFREGLSFIKNIMDAPAN